MSKHIIPHEFSLSKAARNTRNGHPSFVLWFTGLSGSGKSTIANAVEQALFAANYHTYVLDGDGLRNGLNAGLDFSEVDRSENLRRTAEVAKLFVDAGMITLASFISPLKNDRENIRTIIGAEQFYEIFVDTPLEICEQRDVKGLYKKARAGEIQNFTAINAPYEAPEYPDLILKTTDLSLEATVEKVVTFAQQIISKQQYA